MKKLRYIVVTLFILSFFSNSLPVFADNAIINNATSSSAIDAAVRGSSSSCTLDPICWIAKISSTVLLSITGALTLMSGVVLNASIYHTVVLMSDSYTKLTVISDTWGTVRDLANMAFIFVLLWISIQMIIGTGKGNPRELIVKLIMAAVLVNFSLFFTRVIIDAANVLALAFYTGITGTTDLTKLANFSNFGIANAFMDILNLSTLWKLPGSINNGVLILIGLLGSVLLLICAFVFFAIAIMLVIRYVVLILVLILSPLMFIGMILPNWSKYRERWLNALMGQAFFAPAYFFLTWVAVRVSYAIKCQLLGEVNGVCNAGVWTDLAGKFQPTGNSFTAFFSADTMNLVLLFAIVIILVIASLVVAKEQSSKTGSYVSKATGWATGLAGGATFGLAGRASRATLGRAGQRIAESDALRRLAPESRTARLALAVGEKTSKANFDLRGVVSGKIGAGKPQKGGYSAELKAYTDNQKKVAESFKPTEFTISQAERELTKAKSSDINDINFNNEFRKEKKYQEETVRIAKEKLEKAQQRGASPEEINDLRGKVTEAEEANENVGATLSNFKDYKIKKAQAKVDELKGVNEDEVKKRLRTQLEAEGKTKKEIDDYFNSNIGKARIKETQMDSAAVKRQGQYATTLENQSGSPLYDKEHKLRAADQIRKNMKGKSAQAKAAELYKDLVKEKVINVEEEAAPTASTAEGGAPSEKKEEAPKTT